MRHLLVILVGFAWAVGPLVAASADCADCCGQVTAEAASPMAAGCCSGADPVSSQHDPDDRDEPDVPAEGDCGRHLACACGVGWLVVPASPGYPSVKSGESRAIDWPESTATAPAYLDRLKRPPRSATFA